MFRTDRDPFTVRLWKQSIREEAIKEKTLLQLIITKSIWAKPETETQSEAQTYRWARRHPETDRRAGRLGQKGAADKGWYKSGGQTRSRWRQSGSSGKTGLMKSERKRRRRQTTAWIIVTFLNHTITSKRPPNCNKYCLHLSSALWNNLHAHRMH